MGSSDGIGRYAGDLVALLVVIVWGINFVMLKEALAQWDALAFTFVRFLIMLLLSLAVLLWTARNSVKPLSHADVGQIALAGLLGFTLYMLLSIVGIDRTTAFSNALLLAITPLFTTLFLRSLHAEKVTAAQWLAMLVSFVGVLLFLADKAGAGLSAASAGDLLCLAAAACFAAYAVVNRPLLTQYSASRVTAWALSFGSIPVLLLTAPALSQQDWPAINPVGWILLLWSATVPTYLCWTLWSWVNHRAGVGRSAMFLFLVPIVSGVTSWLLLDEGFGPLKLAGALLTLAGLILAHRATRPRQESAVSHPATTTLTARDAVTPHPVPAPLEGTARCS